MGAQVLRQAPAQARVLTLLSSQIRSAPPHAFTGPEAHVPRQGRSHAVGAAVQGQGLLLSAHHVIITEA